MSFLTKVFGQLQSNGPCDVLCMPRFEPVYQGAALQGLWIKDEGDARDRTTVAWLLRTEGASEEMIAQAHSSDYRVVRDHGSRQGGWLCLFGVRH
jgi:hypothetical protein